MTMDDTALREQARQQIQDTVLSYLRENRHLEHVVDEIMLEVDRIGIALRDAARAEQQEASADLIYDLAHSMAERGLFVRDGFGEPNILAIRELEAALRSPR